MFMLVDATILFQIPGIGIVTALIHTILKQMGKEDIAQFVSLVGFIIVLNFVVNHLSQLFQQMNSIFFMQGIKHDYYTNYTHIFLYMFFIFYYKIIKCIYFLCIS